MAPLETILRGTFPFHWLTTVANERDSKDTNQDLVVPAAPLTPDRVLAWPIFEAQFLPDYFTSSIHREYSARTNDLSEGLVLRPRSRVHEEDTGRFIELFLSNVHTRHPFLNIEVLREKASAATEYGHSWDPWSCMNERRKDQKAMLGMPHSATFSVKLWLSV